MHEKLSSPQPRLSYFGPFQEYGRRGETGKVFFLEHAFLMESLENLCGFVCLVKKRSKKFLWISKLLKIDSGVNPMGPSSSAFCDRLQAISRPFSSRWK